MNSKSLLFSALTVMILTVSCTSIQTTTNIAATPESTISPTQTASTVDNSLFRTPTPTTTSTPFFIWVTPTLSPGEQILISKIPQSCSKGGYSFLLSPDENRLAYFCPIDKVFIIANKNEVSWFTSIEEIKALIPYYDNFDTSGMWIEPIGWSSDSQYLYLDISFCCWDPPYSLFGHNANILKYDVINKVFEDVISGTLYVTISPDKNIIIIIDELGVPIRIHLIDLQTNEIIYLTLEVGDKYFQAANLVWSPDGTKFVVVAYSGELFGAVGSDEMAGSSVVLVDLTDMSQRVIIPDSTDIISIKKWLPENILICEFYNVIDEDSETKEIRLSE